jgi:hypothetical protein
LFFPSKKIKERALDNAYQSNKTEKNTNMFTMLKKKERKKPRPPEKQHHVIWLPWLSYKSHQTAQRIGFTGI